MAWHHECVRRLKKLTASSECDKLELESILGYFEMSTKNVFQEEIDVSLTLRSILRDAGLNNLMNEDPWEMDYESVRESVIKEFEVRYGSNIRCKSKKNKKKDGKTKFGKEKDMSVNACANFVSLVEKPDDDIKVDLKTKEARWEEEKNSLLNMLVDKENLYREKYEQLEIQLKEKDKSLEKIKADLRKEQIEREKLYSENAELKREKKDLERQLNTQREESESIAVQLLSCEKQLQESVERVKDKEKCMEELKDTLNQSVKERENESVKEINRKSLRLSSTEEVEKRIAAVSEKIKQSTEGLKRLGRHFVNTVRKCWHCGSNKHLKRYCYVKNSVYNQNYNHSRYCWVRDQHNNRNDYDRTERGNVSMELNDKIKNRCTERKDKKKIRERELEIEQERQRLNYTNRNNRFKVLYKQQKEADILPESSEQLTEKENQSGETSKEEVVSERTGRDRNIKGKKDKVEEPEEKRAEIRKNAENVDIMVIMEKIMQELMYEKEKTRNTKFSGEHDILERE